MEALQIARRRYVDILSVEDNAADRRLLQELLKKCKVECRLHFVKNGIEAMDYLFHKGTFAEATRPDLVLLDLNMPKMDGRSVLKVVKEHPSLKEIPVLVLTTSSLKSDVQSAYSLHANTFLTKPADLVRYESLIKAIEDFWFKEAELPGRDC